MSARAGRMRWLRIDAAYVAGDTQFYSLKLKGTYPVLRSRRDMLEVLANVQQFTAFLR
jgi:hypothetical protein